ncbi:MAG: YaaL family protein [Clostridia bacterium]|nr:YaaL family protein [Clostridia bacterium]
MQEEFMKDSKIFDKNDKEKEIELMHSIIKTRTDLEQAHKNFEFAEDDLIDYYTYQIKANQSKLDYLTRLAKSKNIVYDLKRDEAV